LIELPLFEIAPPCSCVSITATVKEQAAQIQKVNARLGMSTLQVAENNQ
jgi:hypothetical protein